MDYKRIIFERNRKKIVREFGILQNALGQFSVLHEDFEDRSIYKIRATDKLCSDEYWTLILEFSKGKSGDFCPFDFLKLVAFKYSVNDSLNVVIVRSDNCEFDEFFDSFSEKRFDNKELNIFSVKIKDFFRMLRSHSDSDFALSRLLFLLSHKRLFIEQYSHGVKTEDVGSVDSIIISFYCKNISFYFQMNYDFSMSLNVDKNHYEGIEPANLGFKFNTTFPVDVSIDMKYITDVFGELDRIHAIRKFDISAIINFLDLSNIILEYYESMYPGG